MTKPRKIEENVTHSLVLKYVYYVDEKKKVSRPKDKAHFLASYINVFCVYLLFCQP